jgi:hypothetical protein
MQVSEIIGNRLTKLREELGDAVEARSMLENAIKSNEINIHKTEAAILELEALLKHLLEISNQDLNPS